MLVTALLSEDRHFSPPTLSSGNPLFFQAANNKYTCWIRFSLLASRAKAAILGFLVSILNYRKNLAIAKMYTIRRKIVFSLLSDTFVIRRRVSRLGHR